MIKALYSVSRDERENFSLNRFIKTKFVTVKMVLPRTIFFILSFYFLIASEASKLRRTRSAGEWGYTPENGPSTWGGECQKGTKQSPINIILGSAIVKNFPSFHFGDAYLGKQIFLAKNNGHTIHVTLENSTSQPIIYGGGLPGEFVFEQLHFHWESEHEFDGKRGDLEMHMVHYNRKYGSFAGAATQPDGLVVLAVLFNESEQTDDLIEDFFAYILDASAIGHGTPVVPPGNHLQNNNIDKNEGESFALRDLLPKRVSRFFRYDGSLTTPDCGEVVQWTVFVNRFPVSKGVLESMRTIHDHDHNLIDHNFRPCQLLNKREVFIQFDDQNENSNNNANSNICYFYLLCCCIVFNFLNNDKFKF